MRASQVRCVLVGLGRAFWRDSIPSSFPRSGSEDGRYPCIQGGRRRACHLQKPVPSHEPRRGGDGRREAYLGYHAIALALEDPAARAARCDAACILTPVLEVIQTLMQVDGGVGIARVGVGQDEGADAAHGCRRDGRECAVRRLDFLVRTRRWGRGRGPRLEGKASEGACRRKLTGRGEEW